MTLQSLENLALILGSDGQLHVVGMRKVGAADCQIKPDLFHEILGEVCDSLEYKDETIRSTLINVTNLMSDHCAVQKRVNDLFIAFRQKTFKKMPLKTLIHIL